MEKIRVAIIEDLSEIRNAMRVLINGSQGFECVHVYEKAEDALKDLPDHEIDVVIVDINLPEMNGINCMIQLKEKMPVVLFMMYTVFDDDENIFKALQSGASGYLLKSTSPARILEAIHELKDGGSPMSGEIARRVVEYFQHKNKPSKETQSLTDREKEILNLLQKGFLYKEIADRLFISHETVKKHIQHIYEKMQVANKTEAINKAFR